MDSPFSSQASQSTKLRDRLNREKPNFSNANLSYDVIKNMDDYTQPASSGYQQKQQMERKPTENEELVKYMSDLPSYLEKGENPKEKAFNVGVLDWRCLEKWQYNNRQMDTSSFFATEGLSNLFSNQRMHRKTLQSHLNASPKEGYSSQGVEPVVENVGKFQDLKAASSKPLKGQQNIFRMYQSFSKNQSEIKPKECKRKDKDPRNIVEIEISLDLRNCGAASRSKGKTKIQDGESTSGPEELQEPYCDVNHNYHERRKTVVLPRDDLSCHGRRSTEASRQSFAEGSFPKELYNAYSYSDFPHSCPLLCEDDNANYLQIKQPSSVDGKNIQFSVERSQPPLRFVKTSIRPSSDKNFDEKSSKVMPLNSTVSKSSGGSDLKRGMGEASKSSNPPPTRRFSIGLGRIGRTSTSKDSSLGLHLNSEHVTAKSGSEKSLGSPCLENLSNDKRNNKGGSRSSPLRRLLDPFLKPKDSAEPSVKDPTSTVQACKSSTAQSMKVKLDLKSCKTVSVDDSHRNEKHRTSTVQALLQVAIKNGLPLFTFAVGNNSDILIATVTKVGASRKDENCCIYTFFSVHEVKKKSGWINQGSKGKSRGYVPNVVARMMVRHNSVDELGIREFILFAMDSREAEQQTSYLNPNDELAAIVVKFPKETPTSLNKDGHNEENGSSVRSRGLGTTVILPCGVHGLPSKGEPSPLIERWKSGGMCDCGGWDIGCRTTVLANQIKPSRRSSSSGGHHVADRFDLFSQGEVLDDKPVFSLYPFKDRIFSVEFNSPLSFLQAFSICIAVLNGRKPYELSESSSLFGEKSFEETTLLLNDGIKAPNQIQAEFPAGDASYPTPLSPVERV
ncbi:uncharacterized protein LOC114274394 [Camellia sinensis]|uniref:uncharacterized protein LOC114274394 n=1 Tax=Camellia sinensis TaxID=4442 RepID=UPI00103680E2|nr:uncharacterized protein LOC114274394 [Camellia sinensis]XP_028072099.1 uncharacterized protein LOC114274394 [Camellia sinensis]